LGCRLGWGLEGVIKSLRENGTAVVLGLDLLGDQSAQAFEIYKRCLDATQLQAETVVGLGSEPLGGK
jgi:hypothetical protein